jgi:hypothetical protein
VGSGCSLQFAQPITVKVLDNPYILCIQPSLVERIDDGYSFAGTTDRETAILPLKNTSSGFIVIFGNDVCHSN